MQIKAYSDKYKHEVAKLILHVQNAEFGIPITLEMQPDVAAIPAYYQVNNGNFWIALSDDKVIGTISLLDIGNQKGALRKMFVDKNFRGKEFGVGQMLLYTLLESAKETGIKEIYLGTTKQFTAAQRFYEKNGFLEIPKHSLPESFPIMGVDVKFYRFLVD